MLTLLAWPFGVRWARHCCRRRHFRCVVPLRFGERARVPSREARHGLELVAPGCWWPRQQIVEVDGWAGDWRVRWPGTRLVCVLAAHSIELLN